MTDSSPKTQPHLIFLDTETTGLDPDRHEIWEVGYIEFRNGILWSQETRQFPVFNLAEADPYALNIGQFYERRLPEGQLAGLNSWSKGFAKRSSSAQLVGAVPDFDSLRLGKLLKKNGACPGWHYHLVCVENLLAGKLGVQPPWKSDDLYSQAGIDRENYAKHTAMGDCLLNVDVYDFVMETQYGELVDRSMK